MLEMIVLGQVPGTHLQITFSWLMAAAFVSIVWLDAKGQAQQPASKKRKPTRRAKVTRRTA